MVRIIKLLLAYKPAWVAMHKLLDLFLFKLVLLLQRIFTSIIVLSIRLGLTAHHRIPWINTACIEWLATLLFPAIQCLLFQFNQLLFQGQFGILMGTSTFCRHCLRQKVLLARIFGVTRLRFVRFMRSNVGVQILSLFFTEEFTEVLVVEVALLVRVEIVEDKFDLLLSQSYLQLS